MSLTKDKKIEKREQAINVLKSSGISCGRAELKKQDRRFYKENESAIVEASNEQKVLRMKRFYVSRGWEFPPRKHHIVTVVHLINSYYGKTVCKHTPEDELEKKIKKIKKNKSV